MSVACLMFINVYQPGGGPLVLHVLCLLMFTSQLEVRECSIYYVY